jgi:hypothetical protein
VGSSLAGIDPTVDDRQAVAFKLGAKPDELVAHLAYELSPVLS